MIGATAPDTPNSFLCMPPEFTNLVLELEFKVASGLNSGMQIGSQAYGKATEMTWNGKTYKVPTALMHGYQVEIDSTLRVWTAGS